MRTRINLFKQQTFVYTKQNSSNTKPLIVIFVPQAQLAEIEYLCVQLPLRQLRIADAVKIR